MVPKEAPGRALSNAANREPIGPRAAEILAVEVIQHFSFEPDLVWWSCFRYI
jgi:hypothetical protein